MARSAGRLSALALSTLTAACADSNPSAPSPRNLVILTDSLPHAVQFEPYSAGVAAAGGAGGYSWSIVDGALPPGIEMAVADLSDDALALTGTPEAAVVASVTFRVRSADGQNATRRFDLVVRPPPTPVAIANVALPPTVIGQPYDVPLRAMGGDGVSFAWSLEEGPLPPGLELAQDGRITGVPSATGLFPIMVRVSSGGTSWARSFDLRVVPHARDAYRLTVYPVVSVPPGLQVHLDAAVARWERVLTADLEGGPIGAAFFGAADCAGFGQAANGASVDDLLLMVSIDSIDGPGRVLGQAGPCGLRGNGLPFVGVIILDRDDLVPLTGTTTLTAIITHEIGHVLGIGALWRRFGFLADAGSSDPGYIGPAGVAAYEALGGQSSRVPVENKGGEGTAGSHWREAVFDRELMTGFSEAVGVPQPLSALTVAALQDLGYAVDTDAADPYVLPGAGLRAGPEEPPPGYDIVGAGPLRVAPWGASLSPLDQWPRP